MKKRQEVTNKKGGQKQIAEINTSSIEIGKDGIKGIGPWGIAGTVILMAMLLFAASFGVRLWQ
jgi:hypothetical protein